MGADSKIEWTHHTFNPWIGCTKVSPACDNCYAERDNIRWGHGNLWQGERRRTKTWGNPIKWNREAAKLGIRYRVFCASMADVFDNQVPSEWRDDLWLAIKATTHLDWLLLTKRPQNIKKMLPDDWGVGYPNVWLGTTVENQTEADRRIPHLINTPASVRFLSCEPLLGPVFVPRYGIHWIIIGGESGPGCREAETDWYRGIRDQCQESNIPLLFKQYSGVTKAQIKAKGRELDGVIWDQYPASDSEGGEKR